jgi:hypothetical protein
MNNCRTRGRELIGVEIDELFVKDDHIELIQSYPCVSPVMTRDDERSSTMSFKGVISDFFLVFTALPSLATLTGGKSPFWRGSSKRFRSSFVTSADRMLQCEIVIEVVHRVSRVSMKREDAPK